MATVAAVAPVGELADEEEDEVLTNEEQIERLKQKLQDGALGPYQFAILYGQFHITSLDSNPLNRSLKSGHGRKSFSITRTSTQSSFHDGE